MFFKLFENFIVEKGNFEDLFVKVQDYVVDKVKFCELDKFVICDGF